mmetsp:Transcript_1212/g.3107  ORF Transcript_1212/g.3107 Transcript_1212/m.3107 type:complete len:87 (+) Transcript_1212:85-345(+)|eukprot:CAMPEP_0174924278 /NCGR_PEP_ID=MMETSP1355-20121228/7145_1 /TAXON_ID=464990 /ORGANISM="Hemiselmis tepida, Strain CCMP443" /LENGTH=86 /DNA_ID=CAMNT_0016170061 /DNA_START=86 /DNA_END=346 /DNA_ORIENTATION=+
MFALLKQAKAAASGKDFTGASKDDSVDWDKHDKNHGVTNWADASTYASMSRPSQWAKQTHRDPWKNNGWANKPHTQHGIKVQRAAH